MRRRDFLAGVALLLPSATHAQQTDRVRRIGYLTGATGAPDNEAGVSQIRTLVEGLRGLGWVDGRNIIIDHRFSGSGRGRIQATAKELVATNPDLILSIGGLASTAVLAETRTIPVVFTNVTDPVSSGFVASLAHPGGNATGIAVGEAPIAGKWVELLKEIAPETSRLLVLVQAASPPQLLLRDAVAAAAAPFRIDLVTAMVREIADYEHAIAAFAGQPNGGLVPLSNTIIAANREKVHALALRYRLPAVYSYPTYARSGGLISYGPDNIAIFTDAVGYVDRILRGAKPGDLPVQLPTRFALVVNLKTARALGLAVPQSLLQRADEVIE